MKPNLALFRAGPKSLHPQVMQRLAEQNFDVALSWYGDVAPHAPEAVFVHQVKGAKWPGLFATLTEHRRTISQYAFVWLPDDDLLCEPETVSRMFSVCSDLKLDLAQPALTLDSYYSHPITLRHAAFQLRFTNFVEIMAPVLAAEFLAKVTPTLSGNLSGWGLDALWPRMSRLGRVAIIDDTPLRHTLPIKHGHYAANQAAGIPAITEDWMVSAGAFIEAPADFHLNLGGLLQSGDAIALSAAFPEIERMLRALIDSVRDAPISAWQYARYLSNHLNYCIDGRPRYPREVVRAVLNETLAGSGICIAAARAQQASFAANTAANAANTAANTAASAAH